MSYLCQNAFARENEKWCEFYNLQFLSLPRYLSLSKEGRFGGGFNLLKV